MNGVNGEDCLRLGRRKGGVAPDDAADLVFRCGGELGLGVRSSNLRFSFPRAAGKVLYGKVAWVSS